MDKWKTGFQCSGCTDNGHLFHNWVMIVFKTWETC